MTGSAMLSCRCAQVTMCRSARELSGRRHDVDAWQGVGAGRIQTWRCDGVAGRARAWKEVGIGEYDIDSDALGCYVRDSGRGMTATVLFTSVRVLHTSDGTAFLRLVPREQVSRATQWMGNFHGSSRWNAERTLHGAKGQMIWFAGVLQLRFWVQKDLEANRIA
ncbi:hypothetical protein BDV96DRAFT_62334 [Lophiotrema nucula]|uniref:Uncharacterized protein n=1 Tax=Lophiotrema nucula TaxID=690887 RepID=A0A6A5ZA90_9PLEO|nr:hypothetical protein BDV96DRAFT_62334 [Lophiotrema nucula]